MLLRTQFLHPRRPSLLRGIVLSMTAFAWSLHIGGFPDLAKLHSSAWQVAPALMAFAGMVETARRMDPRKWTLFHAGVLILLYSEVMILGLAVFLFFYP